MCVKPKQKKASDATDHAASVDYTRLKPGSFSRIGASNDLLTTLSGGLAVLALWATWILGIVSPAIVIALLLKGHHVASALLIVFLSYPFVVTVKPWPEFVQFFLMQGNWFRGGATVCFDEGMENLDTSGPIMLAMHPHGIFAHSFILNGAARIHARKPEVYLPPLHQNVSTKCTGVAEPLLFKIPLIRPFLDFFGCAEPASKERVKEILGRRVPFGILPGGSDEIIIAEKGKENVYIKNRKGFIKYGLQEGYTICIGYCFGESETYNTIPWFKEFRLWLMHKTGIMLFGAWGKWFCPLLPCNNAPLITVVGSEIRLPKIEHPTPEEVDKWHALYVEKLQDLFDRNKAWCGYKDRSLNIY